LYAEHISLDRTKKINLLSTGENLIREIIWRGDKVKSVLIVDDLWSNLELLEAIFTNAGFEVFSARDANSALSIFKSHKIDIAIVDIMMPGKSGRELLPEIVNSHPEVAVIMSTAVVDPRTIIECMKQGAQDYITKPYEPEDILSTVNRVISQQRSIRNWIILEEKSRNHLDLTGSSAKIRPCLKSLSSSRR
jgi:DNA-binding NtrC family response regulator